ncbi:aromatase/cyclase [Marinactinospora rubrisoli]|uniref:Aromatase/cyclase n=1 Tax=Marinactinospora rubrisoli TaxID=2715399 RepID=A0ABW2KPU3_9ACTN
MAATTRTTEHTTTVHAPADTVYELIADVTQWPHTFPPTIHTERIHATAGHEHIHIWALANGDVTDWTSRRHLDPTTRTIRFHQDTPHHPVAAMSGTWTLKPLTSTDTLLTLTHDFQAVDNAPHHLDWIERAVHTNSTSELDRLKHAAETRTTLTDLTLHFHDTLHITGDPTHTYDFLHRADLWPTRLPHVAHLDLHETPTGTQTMTMHTQPPGGGPTHTTRSIRLCFPPHRIVYKQTTLPALMTAHTGEWLITPDGNGGHTATSRHTVVLNPATIPTVLGQNATTTDARTYVHNALSTNSRTTLHHAKHHTEHQPA